MIKNNKGKLILSSILILLPMLFGIFATPRGAFLVLPPILLVLHWLCVLLTALFDKRAPQSKKVMGIVFWILPALSFVACGSTFSLSRGHSTGVFTALMIFLAVMFIAIGNYMPKTTRNLTMGIKMKWTLSSDENWNATHRFAGKVFVAAGILCLLSIPLSEKFFPYVMLVVILACAVLPVVYSYRLYKKQLADGKIAKESTEEILGKFTANAKRFRLVAVAVLVVVILAVVPIVFGGGLEFTLGDDALTIEASSVKDMTIAYAEIDAVEYREGGVNGTRVFGVASAKLLLGQFQNEEFDLYTRYTYTGKLPAIVLTVGEKTVVIGAETVEETSAIYERLLAEIAE